LKAKAVEAEARGSEAEAIEKAAASTSLVLNQFILDVLSNIDLILLKN